jgi:transposase InsO family protein
VVLDLFSRQVVGWSMDAQMPQELTLAALDMALKRRRPLPGCMHHSDLSLHPRRWVAANMLPVTIRRRWPSMAWRVR